MSWRIRYPSRWHEQLKDAQISNFIEGGLCYTEIVINQASCAKYLPIWLLKLLYMMLNSQLKVILPYVSHVLLGICGWFSHDFPIIFPCSWLFGCLPTSLRALHSFLDGKQQIGTAAANVAASAFGAETGWNMLSLYYPNHIQLSNYISILGDFIPIYPLIICYIAIENDHRNSGFSH